MPFDGREGLKFTSSLGLSRSALPSCYPVARRFPLVPMTNPSAYWCHHPRSILFFHLYLLFSFPFSSPAPGTRCWVPGFSEHVIFWYSFLNYIFIPPHLSSKTFKEGRNIHAVLWNGVNADEKWKSGGWNTHTHHNLLWSFFFFALILKRVRGRTGKALQKVAGVFIFSLFFALPLSDL